MGQNTSKTTFRKAVPGDEALVFAFVQALARYEDKLEELVSTPEQLGKWMFEKQKAEAVFLLEGDTPCGMALYYYQLSTFAGRPGIYLEDLFVLPEFRGRGYGKALLKKVANIGVEEGCGRMEWTCLDWNQPSLDFYKSMGAVPVKEWILHRLTGENLETAAILEGFK